MTRDEARPTDISVAIPAYNAEAFITGTLESVAKQTMLPKEVVVADDGSTDATCACVETFARAHPELTVRLLREPHRGPGAARNAAVRGASSRWVAFLDSDDLWYPGKISAVTYAIGRHPDANFVYHNMMERSVDGTERVAYRGEGLGTEETVPRQLYVRNYFTTSSIVCTRELVLSCGGFDERLGSAQDYELWLRMSPRMVPLFVQETLGTYVERKGSITTSRIWKRLLDLLTVKHRHRRKVDAGLYAYTMLYAAAMHVAVLLLAKGRRLLSGGRGPR